MRFSLSLSLSLCVVFVDCSDITSRVCLGLLLKSVRHLWKVCVTVACVHELTQLHKQSQSTVANATQIAATTATATATAESEPESEMFTSNSKFDLVCEYVDLDESVVRKYERLAESINQLHLDRSWNTPLLLSVYAHIHSLIYTLIYTHAIYILDKKDKNIYFIIFYFIFSFSLFFPISHTKQNW